MFGADPTETFCGCVSVNNIEETWTDYIPNTVTMLDATVDSTCSDVQKELGEIILCLPRNCLTRWADPPELFLGPPAICELVVYRNEICYRSSSKSSLLLVDGADLGSVFALHSQGHQPALLCRPLHPYSIISCPN